MAEEARIKENRKPLSTFYFCSSPKMWRQKHTKVKKKGKDSQKYR